MKVRPRVHVTAKRKRGSRTRKNNLRLPNPRTPNARGIVYQDAILLGVASETLDRLREALNGRELIATAARRALGLTVDSKAVIAVIGGPVDYLTARAFKRGVREGWKLRNLLADVPARR